MRLLPQLTLAVVVIVITSIAVFLTRRSLETVLTRGAMRPALVMAIRTLAGISVWILGILLAITIAFPSVTPAKMLGAIGLGGVAIGLAFREMLENFMAGIMIMVRKPMRIGDVIVVDDVYGQIEQITMRDTYVRQISNELILVPNAKIYKNPVEIITDLPLRRHQIVVGVAYGEDADNALKVIEKAVNSVDEIDKSVTPEVFAREFNASSIDFTVRWWAGSQPEDMHRSRSAVVLAVKRALDDAGIEIPFPYRTLTFKGPVPVEMADQGQE
ncbi:MAG: mechanosensitive ion channel family protein [Alphaproteobacteria bacterium]|nr:mechanosensitive ion channel family protein [Alphaproteobacteria bacterium SS10]